MSATISARFVERVTARGGAAVVGDPGRSYLPRRGLVALATHDVPVPRALEDADVKRTTVWLLPAAPAPAAPRPWGAVPPPGG